MPREPVVSRSLGHLPGVLARRAPSGSLLALLAVVAAAACATSANPRSHGSFFVPDGDADRVRRATLAALRDEGWHLDEVRPEEARTTIRSEWRWVGMRRDEFVNCMAPPDTHGSIRGRMQVEIIPADAGVDVMISAHFRARRQDDDGWDSCASRGVAEDELRKDILSILAERRTTP